MSNRRPLVLISGAVSELPIGDSTVGATIGLVALSSGLYLDGASNLGYNGEALASGTVAQATADAALASGNAALGFLNTGVSGQYLVSSGPGSPAQYGNLYNITVASGNKTLYNRERCSVITPGVVLTTPASPQPGYEVAVTVAGYFTDTVISGNSNNIMSSTEDLTIDVPNVTVSLYYVDATRGWRVV